MVAFLKTPRQISYPSWWPVVCWDCIRRGHLKNACKTWDEIVNVRMLSSFIDEIHEIVGAGNAGDGNMDAGNILKTCPSRDNWCRSNNTQQMHHWKMLPWASCMQPVKVDEPTVEKPSLFYVDSNIKTTTTSNSNGRSILQLQNCPTATFATVFNDKAIDLLDEAGSRWIRPQPCWS